MKKWFLFWVVVVVGLYGLYTYTVNVAEKFNTDVGTAIERVAGRRNN